MTDPPLPPGRDRRGDTMSRNAVFAFVSQMSTAAFTAALTVFLTRKLGPAAFGTFSLALGVTGLLLGPAAGGTTQAAARFIAEHHGDTKSVVGVLGMALRIRIFTATAIGCALFALAEPISTLYNAPELVGPLRGAALAFIGQNLVTFIRNALIALREASEGLTLVASESAMEFAATIGLVLAGGGATAAAFGRAAGYAFGAVLGVALLTRLLERSPLVRTGKSPIARKRFASYAGAMFVVASVTAVYGQLNILLLGAFLSASAVGIYSAPARFVGFLGYPGLAISQGVAPRLARHPDDPPQPRALARALGYVIIFQAWLSAVLLAWATPIVHLLLGSGFSESASVLRALVPYIFLNGIGPLVSSSLNYAGEGRRRIPIAIASLLIAGGLDVLLIPRIGVLGAAVSSDITFAFSVASNLWLARRFISLPLRPLAATTVRSLGAAGVAAAIFALLGTQDLAPITCVIGLLAGGSGFIGMLLLIRELTWWELRRLVTLPIRALRRSR